MYGGSFPRYIRTYWVQVWNIRIAQYSITEKSISVLLKLRIHAYLRTIWAFEKCHSHENLEETSATYRCRKL